ncbi:MAG: C25 family cysteine peptidase [Planctomycetota bacterium]|jgi:hypothetical protein
MRTAKTTVVLAWILAVFSAGGTQADPIDQNESNWIPFVSSSTEGALSRTMAKSSDNTGILVASEIPGMYVHDVNVEGELYQTLRIPNAGHIAEVGKPRLPVIKEFIEVPRFVDVTVEIFCSDYNDYICYNVYPAQEALPDIDTHEAPQFVIDQTTYSTDEFYPSSIAEMEQPVILRGHRIIPLILAPIQFNPVTRELRCYSSIEVRIEYAYPEQIDGVPMRLESDAFEDLCENVILNYKSPGAFLERTGVTAKSADPNGAEYLIITDANFVEATDSLAEWKRRKGYKTKVVTTSTTGTTAAQIRQYVQDAYDDWNPAPTYLLLVGDSEFIPTNYDTNHPSPKHGDFQTATDLYYVTVDGNDYFPDMFIGRISVDSNDQAQTVIDKILDYETSPPSDPCFYNEVSVCAYFEDKEDDTSDGFEDRRYVLTSEEIRDYLLTESYTVERIYCAEATVDPNHYNDGLYANGEPLPADLLRPTFAWDGDSGDITGAINAGRFIINHRDHGGSCNFFNHDAPSWANPRGQTEGWGDPRYTTTDIASLTNGDERPIVFSINCNTGWFDGEIDQNNDPCLIQSFESLCEEFLRHPDGGAVAAIGATRISYSGYNDDLAKGFYDAIWPGFIDPNQQAMYELGQVLTYGKIYMFLQMWGGYNQTQFELFHLFGDPEMTIRKEQPQNLTVRHSSEIKTGVPQSINVNVRSGGRAVNHARIGLYKPGDIQEAGYTDVAGNATIGVTASTTGFLYITVTEVNSVPYSRIIRAINTPAKITLAPNSGPVGRLFTITGTEFHIWERVNLDFGSRGLGSTTASAAGGFTVSRNVPSAPDGPTTVTATGQTSGKTAVAVFTVVPPGPPPDPYIYKQWNSTTWHLNPNGSGPDYNPTWNNPCIQLYDVATGAAVSSGNLKIGTAYRVDATIHNTSATPANNTQVTFEWSDLSTGQPTGGWRLIGTDTVNVPGSPNTVTASAIWTPILTGHCCINVDIYHGSDSDMSNNKGWENTRVKPISSPTEIPFTVYNTTENPGVVELELTQRDAFEPYLDEVWETYIERSCPQTLEPDEGQTAILHVNAPESAYIEQRRILSLTARINGEVIGGIEFELVKDVPVRAYDPSPANGVYNVPADTILSWQSGTYATSHDVYMGTDETVVRDANEYWIEYQGSVTAPFYTPPGPLDFGQTYYWRIDEVNPMNPDSPWKGDVWEFTVETGTAHSPYPSDGAANVTGESVALSWLPGRIAAEHDVYFGTSFYDVYNATVATADVYQGRQAETYYNATELTLDNTYYWRIDEVNGLYILQGDVWSFSTRDYLVIDDFESYSSSEDMSSAKWTAGYTDDCISDYNMGGELSLQQGTDQTMVFEYDNSYFAPFGTYSEARYDVNDGSGTADWTGGGLFEEGPTLSISFKGAAGNATGPNYDRMYVAIEDSEGDRAMVLHEDPNAQANPAWQEWNIPLGEAAAANGVNLEDVDNLYLGFGVRCYSASASQQAGGTGTVEFDDIRLYGQRCLPETAKSDGDLNYDCVVDASDVQILAEEWLLPGCCRSDLNKNRIVEFMDFATLGSDWLEEQL